MFPKTVSFEMGQELCFYRSDGVLGAKGSPITRFYNVPSATYGFYCSYLATTVIDTNITQITSGAVTTINSLRDTLSTPLLRRDTESGSLGRPLSVKQKSALAAANLVVEERLMEERKNEKKIEAAEEKKIEKISTMDDAQKKLYYKMRSENSSLKKTLNDMAQKYEN